MPTEIPNQGKSPEDVLNQMRDLRSEDADWRSGKTWSLVYYAGEEVLSLLKEAYGMFFSENGLSPLAFPSLRTFENEVIAMTADLLNGGDDATGSMTSGGTESILMAVKAAREYAREHRPDIDRPEMILPITVHPAFEKAAHYFDVKPVRIPIRDDFRADPTAARAAISDRTILMVGSAPAYPHGVIDPIEELAGIAAEHDLWFHVDSCLGGFLLPFLERLGHPVPPFDLRVPGVTSISADIHKYGFAAKGASTVIYRNASYRKHQFFVYPDFPGGVYASPTMTGTRPGGAIAAAWAVLNHIGIEGYQELAKGIIATTKRLMAGIEAIPGLRILGEPDMSVFAFTSDEIDVYLLGEKLEEKGWHLDRNQNPPALHMMVTPVHEPVIDPFLESLEETVSELRESGETPSTGMAAIYGMANAIPDRSMVADMTLQYMEELFQRAH